MFIRKTRRMWENVLPIWQVLIDVSPCICVFQLCHLIVYFIHGSHNFIQHQWCRYFKDCVTHIFGIRTFFISMKIFNKWEHHSCMVLYIF